MISEASERWCHQVGETDVSYGRGKDALIRAAVEIVAERGLRGMTFRAVAEAAGVNNALIAHHFGNREGLLSAAMNWTAEQMVEKSAFKNAASQPEAFQQAMDTIAVMDRNLLVFQYEIIIEASRNERYREPVRSLYQAYFRGLSPDEESISALTRARFAALDGLVLQSIGGAITLEEFDESLQALLQQVWAAGSVKQN